MKPKSLIGWGILALVLAAIAYFVSLPVALLTLAFVSGSPLFTIMVGAAVLGAMSLPRAFDAEFDGMAASMLNVGLGDPVEVMSTIPLFIYAGYLLAEAGTADRLVRFANALLGWVPGGLAIVTIGTCALFTVFTGASGVTIIALGGVLMPALVRHGYPERFSMGLIAGTGSVGLLFPPALPLFIYGTVCGLNMQKAFTIPDATGYFWPQWDTSRFIFSGILPGLVLVAMLSAVAVFVAVKKKLPRQHFSPSELGRSFVLALPELIIPFGVILGLAKGFSLPEIASLTVVYVVVLETGVARVLAKSGVSWGKSLPFKVLWTTSREAIAMVGAIFIIIFTSTVMTNFLVTADVPTKLVAWTSAHVHSDIVFLLAVNVILLVVGTVMDIFSAIVIVVPLILGIAHHYHINPYHLGVIFLLNLEVGYLHPPVGLNLFITSVKFQRPITEVMWATIPFLITMFVALFTITYIPQITAWSTPEEERTGKVTDLSDMVHTAAEEITSIKTLTFVDAAGAEIKGKDGKALTAKREDCEKLEDQAAKDTCLQVFFDVTACKGDKPCANKTIAKWVASNNSVQDDPGKQIVLDEEIALVNDKGEPVKDKKSGQLIVKKHAACEEGSLGDECRSLFVNVADCKISPPDDGADACVKAAIVKWVESNVSSKLTVLAALVKTLRPRQWVKNVFVAAPIVFARHLEDSSYLAREAVAVLAFCLLSGAVYCFNDVRDVEADRAHPTKKKRPIAAGALGEKAALTAAAVLAVISLGACLAIRWQLAAFAAVYLVQNIAYSVKLKHVAFVDVALITSGFLLRVLAGAAAIDVPASGWLLLCTALLASFTGFGKRAHELAWAERSGQATETRASLAGYRLGVVRVAMLVLAVATCVAYVAYTVDSHTVAFFGTDRLVYSSPFVALGILRFLFLALWYPKDDPPTEAMLRRPWFMLDLTGATAVVLYIIYG